MTSTSEDASAGIWQSELESAAAPRGWVVAADESESSVWWITTDTSVGALVRLDPARLGLAVDAFHMRDGLRVIGLPDTWLGGAPAAVADEVCDWLAALMQQYSRTSVRRLAGREDGSG